MLSRFHLILERYGQTDRWTDSLLKNDSRECRIRKNQTYQLACNPMMTSYHYYQLLLYSPRHFHLHMYYMQVATSYSLIQYANL